ncbi:unnamed protein product, partial [Didymodactylos carnosus]
VEEHRSFKFNDICLASWKQDTIQYLIVQSSYSNQAYCMSYQIEENVIVRNDTSNCMFEEHTNNNIVYTGKYMGPCSSSNHNRFCLIPILVLLLFFYAKRDIR